MFSMYKEGMLLSVYRFFPNFRNLYATALANEVLCICAADIGHNSSFLIFGYKTGHKNNLRVCISTTMAQAYKCNVSIFGGFFIKFFGFVVNTTR